MRTKSVLSFGWPCPHLRPRSGSQEEEEDENLLGGIYVQFTKLTPVIQSSGSGSG
jgi:hypothetical protein